MASPKTLEELRELRRCWMCNGPPPDYPGPKFLLTMDRLCGFCTAWVWLMNDAERKRHPEGVGVCNATCGCVTLEDLLEKYLPDQAAPGAAGRASGSEDAL